MHHGTRTDPRDKSDIMSAFEAHVDEIITETQVVDTTIEKKITKDADEDYKFARTQIKSLISKSDEAIDRLAELCLDSEHPRAFEVLSTLIKANSEMNKELLNIAKDRKAVHGVKTETKSGGGNTAVFIGTTADLQKRIVESMAGSKKVD